ncbi:AAA family ATPase [Halobacterium noricense]|uniref:AAA family ATPase n=1 Tax=Halobacterium noricense TaxID=223182 RepID=UPI001E39E49D|nr:AAA family ATPase [Halobacterium noricense]UHH24928.1 AAA family ATPase [Halobacterium noricense]
MSGERAAANASNGEQQPRIVVVCGLPGAGKTTVAEHAADLLDAELLRTDVVRNDLFPDPEYTDAEMRAVYDELFERAATVVRSGDSVVLDGTFQHRDLRDSVQNTANDLGVPATLVKVECEEAVVRERIRQRSGDASDADFAIHQQYRESFDSIEREHAVVDNSEGLASTREQVDVLF